MESEDTHGVSPPVDMLGMYSRMVATLEQLLVEGQRLGDQAVQEWAALGLVEALDLGLALGIENSEEAEQRRADVGAMVDEIDQAQPETRRER